VRLQELTDEDLDVANTADSVAVAAARPTPFVLGGPIRWNPRSWSWRSLVAIGGVLVFTLLPVRGLYRATGSSMEEAFMLVFPRLVQEGKVPNDDFLHLYGPGSLDLLALWYWIAGYTLEAERTFGLIQNIAIILGLYTIVRAWGRIAAAGAGCVAALLVMTPIGLAALAWHGAIALSLWAIVFALRARLDQHRRTWVSAGLLAGLALTFRPDIAIALGLALGVAIWSDRARAARPFGLGALVGLAPMWVHLIVAGPIDVVDGIVFDPVFRLRAGRELPRPPSFDRIDGALQAIAEGIPPWWGLPALEARHQLFFWFFSVVLIAFAVPAHAWWRRRPRGDNDRSPQMRTLWIAGLFGLGILPQAMQRPDSTHLAWVAMVSWPLLVATIADAIAVRHRRPGRASWRPGLSASLIVAVLLLVVCPFYTFRYHLLHTRVSVGDLPLPFLVERDDRRFWFSDPFVASSLNQLVEDLDERSEPGDRIVVGTADLSRTVYSDVSIYFLFPELEPATYYIEMDPGLADAEDSGLAEDIESADFVVLTNFWSGWVEPNTSTRRRSQEHNQAVADNFCLVERYEDNLVLLFERCEGGGGISGADVIGRYPLVPVPEELS